MATVFRALDTVVARVSLLPYTAAAPPLPSDMKDSENLRAFLAGVASDPVAREAIAVSSLSLDGTLGKATAGSRIKPKQLRRGATSAIRYLSRMRSRATPFGLMAGVTSVQFGEATKIRFGDDHRKHVRPDLSWLIEVIRDLHRDPAVLSQLRVVANDLHSRRGDRLVLLRTRGKDSAQRDESWEVAALHTDTARSALHAARSPIRYRDLVDSLCAATANRGKQSIEATLSGLVERDFLLTELYPSRTSSDPIRHVLDTLAGLRYCSPVQAALEKVASALGEYATAPVGEGHARYITAAKAMTDLCSVDRPIHVDLGMDAEMTLPRQVLAELEEAASMAWRVAQPAVHPLAAYHAAFLERYGLGGLVPIKELLDPHTGLGAPSGYLAPRGHQTSADAPKRDASRDHLMCSIAQRAAARGEVEVVIDAELAEQLARPSAENGPATYIEPCVRLFADSEKDLQSGDFRLALSPMNYTRPGAMVGRFLHLLPELHQPFTDCVRGLSSAWMPATAAQLVGATLEARSANVAQVPQVVQDTLAVGVFADTTDPHVLSLDDVAVGVLRDRFFVASLKTGQELVPLLFSANEVRTTYPNPIRLLYQIGSYHTPQWKLWSWGAAAEQLPFLPRIRYGRTVMSPARWLLDARLADATLPWARWREVLALWRDDWWVPDRVESAHSDQLLPLNLTSAADLHMLRDEISRSSGRIVLREQLGGAHGSDWAGGRTVELAIPLRPAPQRPFPAATSALPFKTAADPVRSRRMHPPGGDWLYLRVHANADCHDEILSRHLPALLDSAAAAADRWFFIRYETSDPHLRIRFHGRPDDLNSHLMPAVHAWTNQLAAQGTLREVRIDSYRPEIARYGGPEAIEAAELAFCADSRAVLDQLMLRDQGLLDLPVELLLAANYADLAARLIGDGWQEWLLASYPKDDEHHAVFQRHRREAVELLGSISEPGAPLCLPGGQRLTEIWKQRAPHLNHYGRVVRDLMADGRMGTAPAPFRSILHMHHNRLAGINPQTEQGSYAIARGALQVAADRRRHLMTMSKTQGGARRP